MPATPATIAHQSIKLIIGNRHHPIDTLTHNILLVAENTR